MSLKGPAAYSPSGHFEVPLGLLAIATYCETQGFHVLVLNNPNVTIGLLRRIIAIEKLEALGFYCDAENVLSVMSIVSAR